MSHRTIKVQLDNQTALLRSKYKERKLLPYWSHSVDNFNHIVRARPWYRQCKICHQYPSKHDNSDHDYIPVWDGKVKYLKRDQLPKGLFLATYKDIEQSEHLKFKVNDESEGIERRSRKKWLSSEGKYSFQNTCTDKIYKAAEVGTGGLIINCTGSGKTRIAAMLASRLNCELLFVVDQLVLLRQAQKDIEHHLKEKVGNVGESKFNLERVTVATIQTLHEHRRDPRFLRWYKRVDVLILDEIHEMLNKSNFNVIHVAQPKAVFGLTATLGLSKKPVRLKAYSLCGPILYEYPVQTGMKEGVLSRGIVIQLRYENI